MSHLSKVRFEGMLLGAAVGDAMGMPFQFLHPQVVQEHFPTPLAAYQCAPEGHINAGLEKGQFTDETQLLSLAIEAVLETGRLDPLVIAQGMIRLFNEDAWITPGRSVQAACRHLRNGVVWHEAGQHRDGSKCLAFVPAVVLHHWGDDASIEREASSLARLILVEPRVLRETGAFGVLLHAISQCRDRKDLRAAVLATADRLDATHPGFRDMVKWVLELVVLDVQDGLQELGTGYSILESVYASLYAFLKFPDDFGSAVANVVYAGDSSDTTGFLTGALCGAFGGIGAVPSDLLTGLRERQFLVDLADRFYSLSSPSVS